MAILGRVDSVPLSKLDFALLVKLVHLPSDEGIVVWVGLGYRGGQLGILLLDRIDRLRTGEELSSPVNSGAQAGQVLLGDRREVLEPVKWVGKLLDLGSWNTNHFEDLELICQSGRFGIELSLLSFRWVGGLEGLGGSRGGDFWGGSGGIRGVLRIAGEVFTKHLHLTDKLVSRGLASVSVTSPRDSHCL